ncbi:YkgJ family cysteine cluster protein [Anaerohalosphaera lusitana]|nr:YkgJ family cysteine cluster protein [Anaerohalosphaera lusitana]
MGKIREKWYRSGLHFECMGCGSCCAGPEEGYIWITRPEIQKLADFLGESVETVMQKYIKKVRSRYSIVEDRKTKDCIFLVDTPEGRGCAIYDVRPNQCRTWPFWTGNLRSSVDWNMAAMSCGGINRGPLFTLNEIEERRLQQKWWGDDDAK